MNKTNSLEGKFQILETLGFKTPQHCLLRVEDIPDFYQKIIEWRKSLNYCIDGIVFSIDNVEKMLSLGVFSEKKKPKGQIALKFPPNINLTKIIGVDFSFKGTQIISMVAEIEPVTIDGTVVKRASLKSYRWVKENNVCIGSIVEVVKGGDIIPCIKSVISVGDTIIKYLDKCTYCGGEVKDNGTDLYCSNDLCSAKEASRISRFLKVLGIKGLSWKILLLYCKVGVHLTDFVSKNWEYIDNKIELNKNISKVIWKKIRKQLEEY